MRKVALLGASGSIGSQTLDVLENDPASFELVSFSVGKQIDKIPAILRRFPAVSSICVLEKENLAALKSRFPHTSFFHGDEGLLKLIDDPKIDMVVNAIVGFAGFFPSLEALRQEKILCLANKESLVVGGFFLNEELKKGHGRLYPIDSEHVAIAKCLSHVKREDVKRLVLTASGGAFRSLPLNELERVTPAMALCHPTWKMGARITIDCATMMNKGFEVIEAKELFSFPFSQIDILLHDESCLHSFIELKDGTFLGEIGEADMHLPIAYALYEGERRENVVSFRSLDELKGLHFHPFDPKRYPIVPLALEAAKKPLGYTAVLNASDEEAVKRFLNGEIAFLDIEKIVKNALNNVTLLVREPKDLLTLDAMAREYARNLRV